MIIFSLWKVVSLFSCWIRGFRAILEGRGFGFLLHKVKRDWKEWLEFERMQLTH